MRFYRKIWCNLTQIRRQCLGFKFSQLGCLILLSMQIGDIHPVKIRQNQPANACSCQGNRNIGAKTAQTADGNRCLIEFFLHSPSMSCR